MTAGSDKSRPPTRAGAGPSSSANQDRPIGHQNAATTAIRPTCHHGPNHGCPSEAIHAAKTREWTRRSRRAKARNTCAISTRSPVSSPASVHLVILPTKISRTVDKVVRSGRGSHGVTTWRVSVTFFAASSCGPLAQRDDLCWVAVNPPNRYDGQRPGAAPGRPAAGAVARRRSS